MGSAPRRIAPLPRSFSSEIPSRRFMQSLSDHWTLEPGVIFLNHGSFGACPRVVLEAQSEYRARMERQPVRFLWRELPDLIDAARAELAQFIGAKPENLGFI